ncbi:MAG: Cytochrome c oxidase subunit 3 [Elusimicrobia bacterium]|nr:Cytochrome c oxidase subunit 3 [Elusimicrobiota bacterium]
MSHLAVLDKSAPPAIPDMSPGKCGMWIFLVSEIMFFTGLIGSYIVLRLGSGSWPNPWAVLNIPLLTINTTVLLTSSLTMVLAVSAIEQNDSKGAARQLLFTALLGMLFLVIKVFDYLHMIHQGFTISSDLFGSCYYLLTGFHGLHVLSGVILMVYLWKKTKADSFSSENYVRIESSGLYWHFIDVVWVILFAFLCLL